MDCMLSEFIVRVEMAGISAWPQHNNRNSLTVCHTSPYHLLIMLSFKPVKSTPDQSSQSFERHTENVLKIVG